MMLSTLLLLAAQETPAAPPKREPVVAVVPSSRAQALSPEGTELAFAVDDGSIGFATLSTGVVRLRVDGFPKWMDSIAWSPDGKSLAVVCKDEQVRIVHASDGAAESDFSGSPASKMTPWWGRGVSFVDAGKKLLLWGGAVPIQLRSRDGALLADLTLDKECVSTVCAVSLDGSRFAVGDMHGNVGVWSAADGKPIGAPLRVPLKVNGLALDPTGARLAVCAGDCNVRVFDIGSESPRSKLSHCDQDIFGGLETGSVAFSPDGRQLLSTTMSFHEVRSWNLATGALAWHFDYGGGNPGGVVATFTPDSRLAFASRGGEVHDAADGKLVRRLGVDNSLAPSNSFKADRGLAWNQAEGKLRVSDIASGKLLAEVSLARDHAK